VNKLFEVNSDFEKLCGGIDGMSIATKAGALLHCRTIWFIADFFAAPVEKLS
jgi:hypothetical protein